MLPKGFVRQLLPFLWYVNETRKKKRNDHLHRSCAPPPPRDTSREAVEKKNGQRIAPFFPSAVATREKTQGIQPARSSNGISKEYQGCSATEQRRCDAWSSKVEGKTHKTQAWFPPCLPATWACVRMCVCVKVHTSRSIASRVILMSLSLPLRSPSHSLSHLPRAIA